MARRKLPQIARKVKQPMPTIYDDRPLKDQLSRIEEQLQQIRELLTGNGDPSKGIIIRLDRIEQRESRREWMTRTSLGAAISSIVAFCIALFRSN